MLTSKSYPTRTGVRVIITDDDQCEICRRTQEQCELSPWPDHSFIPRTWRADQLPPWLRARVPDPSPSTPAPPDPQEGLPL